MQVLLDEGVLVRNGVVKLTKPLSVLRIPPTVQMILASRIDRLPPDERDLLQTLAVMGKEFALGLIKKVAINSDDDLERMLSNLQLKETLSMSSSHCPTSSTASSTHSLWKSPMAPS